VCSYNLEDFRLDQW